MQQIWDYLKAAGYNDYAAAGIMGNIDAESGMRSNNLEDTYQREFKMSDEEYTAAVDSGTYTNFVNDRAGYGLCQWTWHTRKQKLYNLAKAKNKSISDINVQLELLIQELKGMTSLNNILKNATTVKQASDAFMIQFENPYDKSEDHKTKRANRGMIYFMRHHKEEGGTTTMATNKIQSVSNVKTYKESDRVQLSKNFNSYEFRCGLGSPCACTTILIDDKLVEILQNIRDHFGVSVTITSAYRCESYNKKIGGAVGSRHNKGQAADISVKGIAPREVAKYAESIGVLGIGLYETQKDGFFVHVDTRDYKSFWYGQSEAKRTTFGGSSANYTSNTTQTVPSVDTITSTTLLVIGNHGDAVKQLQENLNQLGYDCGEPDGIFGANTKKQVVKFQEKNELKADGMAGAMTLAKIDELLKNTTTSTSKKYKVTATLLNVRSGPGIKYNIIGRLPHAATLEAKTTQDGWIQLPTGGWVSGDYVQEV